MFANDVDSDRDEIASTAIDVLAGLMAWFLILKWLKAVVKAVTPEVKDAAAKGSVTIIESVAKRITE